MLEEELKVPRRASIPPSTMATMMLKSTKYQYSLRLDLPLNTAYFLSASRYQLNAQPPHSPRSLGAHCDRKILARGAKACIQRRGDLAPAVCDWIGERTDDLQLLDDRAGPSVRDDERQRIFMFRTNVNEMNVQPVDLGDEVRQGLQLLLDLAPVVLLRPIARECLHRREPRPLRLIFDGLLFGPARLRDASAEVDEFLFRNVVDVEGSDLDP